MHFSGIDPALPYADRYWIHSGTHETFATLFESWLGSPDFLRTALGLDETAVRQLEAFDAVQEPDHRHLAGRRRRGRV